MARKPSKEALEKLVAKKHAEWEAALQKLRNQEEEDRKAKAVNAHRVIALSSALRTIVSALKAEYQDALPTAILDLPISGLSPRQDRRAPLWPV